MTSIQSILILLSAVGALAANVVFRSRASHRVFAVIFFGTAAVCVIFPGLTTDVAKKLGVGRGADLLLYAGVFAGIYAFLLLYLHIRRIEQKLTAVVRELALRQAIAPGPQGPPE